MSSSSSPPERSWVTLPHKAVELQPGGRLFVSGKSGKLITIVRTPHGELFCLDFFCYHMGGRLGEGDLVEIEDMGSWALRCPAHGRLISLAGEAIEQQHASCTSTGLVQRTHEITVDARDNLCVRLNKDRPSTLPSDTYNVPQPTANVQTSIGFHARKRCATQAVQAKLSARQNDEHTKNLASAMATAAAAVPLNNPARAEAHQGTTTATPRPIPSLRQPTIYDMFRTPPSAPAAEMMETD